MADQTAPPNPTVDPYEHLKIVRNLTSHTKLQNSPAIPDPNHPSPVLSKDIPLNQSNKTWLRIFLPRKALDSSSPNKLPLVIYFHGGGFIRCSAATTLEHEYCNNIAIEIPAVIISLDYRLAPQHRLPAAYDDAMEALQFIKTAHDEWLTDYADFANCFLMGTSAGANMAYHVGLRAANEVHDLEPMKIQGLILNQPFFGGSKRTRSELRLVNDPVLPLSACDLMWQMSLPIGADRDKEYCNPTVDGGSKLIERMRLLGWRVLVTGRGGDPLIDRQIEVVRMLEGKSVQVVSQFNEGGYHGIELLEPSKGRALYELLKNFIVSSSVITN